MRLTSEHGQFCGRLDGDADALGAPGQAVVPAIVTGRHVLEGQHATVVWLNSPRLLRNQTRPKLKNAPKIDFKRVSYLHSVFLNPVRVLDIGNFVVVAALDPNDLLVPVSGTGEHNKAADHDVPLITVAHVVWNMV